MKEIYSVSAVNRYIKQMIADDYALNRIYVRGEVSNCKYHSSGHIYFTLKDKGGTISCVMFAGQRIRGLKFVLTEGLQVIVFGRIDVYERDGKYQLYAGEIVRDGVGDLYERYEQLKRRLTAEGLFDEAVKKPLPKFPKKVGIVTSATGAVIQDIRDVSLRRNPYIQLVFYPAKVQGEGAAQAVANGIKALDEYGVDVIIIGRGGGSIEDLWAFNEEIVAWAIYACRTPLISAVGHETDYTIADFAADMRAPTPSAAAELAVPDIFAVLERIGEWQQRLDAGMRRRIENQRGCIAHIGRTLEHLSPEQMILGRRQELVRFEEKLDDSMRRKMTALKHSLELYVRRLGGASPLEKLGGGYAYVSGAGGPVRSVKDVACGDMLELTVRDGHIRAAVTDTDEGGYDGKSKEPGNGI